MLTTRGFTGKGRAQGQLADRLPLDQWTLSFQQDERPLVNWNWAEFGYLPQTEIKTA